MASIADRLPTSPFSARAQHRALGRSGAVAVVGLSVWIALVCSAPSPAGATRALPPSGAPVWTRGAATSLDAPVAARALRPGATPSCALDTD